MQRVKDMCAHVARGAASAAATVRGGVVGGAGYACKGARFAVTAVRSGASHAYQGVSFVANKALSGASSVCKGAGKGVSFTAKAVKGGATSAIRWGKNHPRTCVVLGTLILGTGLVAMHVFYPATSGHAVAVAHQVKDWALKTAFPYIQNQWQVTILPALSNKWTSLSEALYTNGTVTQLGAGLIGGASALVARAVITGIYRYFRPDMTKAERDAARVERDAARVERNAAIVQCNMARAARDAVTAERDAAYEERDAARAERNAAYEERDAARAERNLARRAYCIRDDE